MKYNSAIHRRRSIRLQGYDYSRPGAYFVTICSRNGKCLFGEIADGEERLNAAGDMMVRWYWELENKFPDIECDAFVCMPNHVHFIVVNVGANRYPHPESVGANLCVRPATGTMRNRGEHANNRGEHANNRGEHANNRGEHIGSPLRHVVQWYKTMTTNEYIRSVKQDGWPPFRDKLWQRNYWEHIVRDEREWHRIREYIRNNPAKWELDRLHPIAETNRRLPSCKQIET